MNKDKLYFFIGLAIFLLIYGRLGYWDMINGCLQEGWKVKKSTVELIEKKFHKDITDIDYKLYKNKQEIKAEGAEMI